MKKLKLSHSDDETLTHRLITPAVRERVRSHGGWVLNNNITYWIPSSCNSVYSAGRALTTSERLSFRSNDLSYIEYVK